MRAGTGEPRPGRGSPAKAALEILPAIALALVTLRAATERVADVDVGWIVAVGRRVLVDHAAPTHGMFSFVAPETPWIMHEWLLGPAYALGWQAVGPAIFALVGIGASVALGWLLLNQMRSLQPSFAALWATLLFVFAFDRVRSARPIGLSLVIACVLVVLAFRPRLDRAAIIACFGLELVWTNLHGSFPLGLVILAFACLDAQRRTMRRGHLVALGGAALATMVNPYGLRLHGLVARYALGSDPTMSSIHRRVLEFTPIWRAGYHDVVSPIEIAIVVALVVLAWDALRKREREGGRGAGALALVLCVGAFLQARNASLAILVASLLLLPHAASKVGGASQKIRRTMPRIVPAAVVGLVALLWTLHARRTVDTDDWIDPSIGGAAFARLARRLPDDAKVFVPFRSGGLLLLLASDRGVTTFYDSRNDCYPPDIVATALALKDGELPPEGLAPLLARYGTTHAVVPTEAWVKSSSGDPRWFALAVLEPALRTDFHVVAAADGWVLLERNHHSPT
jgi:hypothetical protein